MKNNTKIRFKKLIYDGNGKTHTETAEGTAYTAANGVKVAIHKEGSKYLATELSTGMLVTERSGESSMKNVKDKVEKLSPTVLKILNNKTDSLNLNFVTPQSKKTAKKPTKKCSNPTKATVAAPAAKSAKKLKPAKAQKPKAPSSQTQAPKSKSYTVGGKTFSTKDEAKAYKALRKQNAGKPCEIKESNRKPTHRVVSFTAKNR